MFDDIISGMDSNRKLSAIVTELFVKETKLNVLIVSILNSYFEVPKTIRINATHYFVMKILTKRTPTNS